MYSEVWPGGPQFMDGEGAFKLGTDSVLLADFANISRARRLIDLGCGGGVLSLLLAARSEKVQIDGVDILPEAVSAAQKNVEMNGQGERVRIVLGDIRCHRDIFPAEAYDHVVSNPPYFPTISGKNAPDERRATARDERSCTLAELCAAAAYLCRWGGSFSLVHRPERLSEVFCAMTAAGIEPKRLRLVSHREDSAPNLVLIEGRRGGKPGLVIEPSLSLTDPDGTDSLEIRRIYHREARN